MIKESLDIICSPYKGVNGIYDKLKVVYFTVRCMKPKEK